MARIKFRVKFNKKKLVKQIKNFVNYYDSHIIASSLVTISIVLIILSGIWIGDLNALNKGFTIKITEADVVNALHLASQEKIEEAKVAKAKRVAEAKQEADIEEWTARVENLFNSYDSPMKGYGGIMVRKAVECGGDYKILVGIAGNESGLGKVPYKIYNPFGYLDGVQYTGWSQSLTKLSCVISQRFIAPCKGDLYCIIRKYGGPSDNQDQWVRNVSYFMSQV
ncbi:MAG: hypothetical protein ABI721_00120 [Candidatus Dojkabacteria bacterium]